MDQPVEVPYAIVQSMMGDLVSTSVTDARAGNGVPVSIQRYVAKSDGRIYECAFRSDIAPVCLRRDDLPNQALPAK